MKKLINAVLFVICSVSSVSLQSSPLTDVELMHKALVELHPGYERYRTAEELSASYNALKAFADNNPSDLKLYAEIQRFLSDLRCEHTVAELPKKLRNQKRERMFPFHLRAFGDKLYISHASAPLQRGDEVLSVNGYTTADIIKTLSDYVSYDGYTTHVINGKIASDYDLLGSYFEVLFPPVILGMDEFPESLSVEVKHQAQQQVATYEVQTIDLATWQTLSGKPYRLNFKDAVSVEYQDKTAILTVDTFVNYREPINAKRKFSGIFKKFKKRKIERLIVDLRNNGGGSDDAQFALLTHLIKKPILINTKAWVKGNSHKDWEDKLTTWDKSLFDLDYEDLTPHPDGYELPTSAMGEAYKKAKPAKERFRGEIILLTSKENSSGSAAALGILAEQSHITAIGEVTGGNLGGTTATIITFLKLPDSGIRVRVPMIRNVYNIPDVVDGYGLTPDIEVELTVADWLAGKDASLARALEANQTEK